MIELDEIKDEDIKEYIYDILVDTSQTLGYAKRRVQLGYITGQVEKLKEEYQMYNSNGQYDNKISEIDKVLEQLNPLRQFQPNVYIDGGTKKCQE